MFNQFSLRSKPTTAPPITTPQSKREPSAEAVSHHPLLGTSQELATTNEEGAESTSGGADDKEIKVGSIPGPLPYKARQKHERVPSGSHNRTNSNTTISSVSGTNAPTDRSSSNPLLSVVSPTLGASQSIPSVPTLNIMSSTSSSAGKSPTTLSQSTTTMTSMPSTATTIPTFTSFSTSTSTSTSNAISSSGFSSGASSLTARLQLQSLKAAGQRMGLTNGSLGMKMLDVLFEKGQIGRVVGGGGGGGEWAEVVKVLTTGGATLLLPSTAASSLPVTPQIVKDHIVFTNSALNKEISGVESQRIMIVTMSGLLGMVEKGKIVFEGALGGEMQVLHDLRDPLKRGIAMSTLQPSHLVNSDTITSYPTFSLTDKSTLPFPPLPQPAPPPPASSTGTRSRSGSNASLGSLQLLPTQSGRLNPFMSLFGHNTAASHTAASLMNGISVPVIGEGRSGETSTPPKSRRESDSGMTSPDTVQSPGSATSSLFSPSKGTAGSVVETASVEESTKEGLEGFDIPAWAISSPVKYSEVAKTLSKALKKTVQEELKELPDKTIDRVTRFVIGSHPSQIESRMNTMTPNTPSSPGITDAYLKFVSADELASTTQSFLEAVYDELYSYYVSAGLMSESPIGMGGLRRKGSVHLSRSAMGLSSPSASTSDVADGSDPVKRKEKERRLVEDQAERLATNGTNAVESMLCGLFYNSFFRPPNSDDERHDEALSSRIAALNLLDLSLDHLGVLVKDDDSGKLVGEEKATRDATVQAGLEEITKAVGQELQRLNDSAFFSPSAKADIMVKAHKIITEGLSKLPRVRLRPDGEGFSGGTSSPVENEEQELVTLPKSPESGSTPPVPPRLSQSLTAVTDEKTPRPAQEEMTSGPETPLDLPEAAEMNELEEAMMGSIIESKVPTAPAEMVDVPREGTLGGGSSGADLLLPLMIFAVVKANPSKLVSQLLFVQRYRSHVCQTGEASYAVVNTTAVVEFLENVDLAELGLHSTDKVFSVADLAPIGLSYLDNKHADTESIASASSRLRGRVLQVGELAGSAAGSANKVLTGVVDSGWGALRTLIAPNLSLPAASPVDVSDPPVRPKQVRKSSNFSLANVTASVASIASGATQRERPRASSSVTREMVDVSSRPGSIRERGEGSADENEVDDEQDGSETEDEDDVAKNRRPSGDSQSIRSVSSRYDQDGRPERVSLSDRFANLVGPSKLNVDKPWDRDRGATSPGLESANKNSFLANLTAPRGGVHTRRTTLLNPSSPSEVNSVHSDSHPATSVPLPGLTVPLEEVAPPIERFMTCDAGDLRLSEIGELLRDYRRLARIVSKE